MKMKQPGRQGLNRQNSWQQAKHPQLDSDLMQALRREAFIILGCRRKEPNFLRRRQC